jgi:hypothetical protein
VSKKEINLFFDLDNKLENRVYFALNKLPQFLNDPDIDKPLEMNVPAISYYRDRCIPAGEYYLYVGLLQDNEWPPWPDEPGEYSFGADQVPLTLNSGGPRQVIEMEILLEPYEE